MAKTSCIYCGSHSYGPGCPFSSHKKHVHSGDPKKCMYCGSMNRGPGCPFNPFSKMHIFGMEYNQMLTDTVENSIVTGYLMEQLQKPIEDYDAFKLGLIDKTGQVKRKAVTLEEKKAYNSLTSYIIGLKQALGTQLYIVNACTTLKLEALNTVSTLPDAYDFQLKFEQVLRELMDTLKNHISEAVQHGLDQAVIEKIIIESITLKK
jgi:hypothetical protein